MPRKKQTVHASGLVEVKVTIGKGLDGKRIQKSFYGSSKLAAREKADEYLLQQAVAERTGEVYIAREYTFEQWAQKWLKTKENSVKQSTYDTTYKAKVDKYLVPHFGKSLIKNIKQIDIQNFFIAHSYLSVSMQDKFRIILHGMFDFAIDNDVCYKNPVKNIKMSETKSAEMRVYQRKDADAIKKYCLENATVDILLLLETGIRRSELLGLQWADIDFDNRYVTISRAVTPNKGKPAEGKPKSEAGARCIPIAKDVLEVLKLCRGEGYVLKGKDGRFMSPSGYSKQYKSTMEKICRHLELEVLNPHELRHTFGTLLRERGVDIYTIQKLMGHSTIEITAKTYVHNDIKVLRKAMKLK